MGDYAKAEPLARQAVDTFKGAVGRSHPEYAASLGNLADLCYARGQLATAAQSYSQGLTARTRWTQGGLATLGERQRIRLLAAQGGALNGYLSVAPAAGMKVEEIYRHALAWKGVVEARQDEDRLARDQPELKETLGRSSRPVPVWLTWPLRRHRPDNARPGSNSSTRCATAKRIWRATCPQEWRVPTGPRDPAAGSGGSGCGAASGKRSRGPVRLFPHQPTRRR